MATKHRANIMRSTLLALLALTAATFAEVPKGVDRKWDSTLTVRLVKVQKGNKPSTISVTATAPKGGDLIITGAGKYTVKAGTTDTRKVQCGKDYLVKAAYKGRLLDSESNRRKTGLGKSRLDSRF